MMLRKICAFLLLFCGSLVLLFFVFLAGCSSNHNSASSPSTPSGPGGGGGGTSGGGGSGGSGGTGGGSGSGGGGSAQVSFSTTTYDSGNFLWNTTFRLTATAHADLNGDGRDDFVSTVACPGGNGDFSVRLSTGDGTYAPQVCYNIPTAPLVPTDFAAGDFLGNGHIDVAVEDEKGNLSIWKNAGDGTLTMAWSTTLPGGQSGIAAVDINHDGKVDLVANRPNIITVNGGTLTVLFSNGDGTFTTGPGTPFNSQVEPFDVAAGDFDGDANVDVVTSDTNGEETEVFYGDGKGNFAAGPTFGGSDMGKTSAVLTEYEPFDVDGNHITDLIGSPSNYTFCGTGCYPPPPTGNNYVDVELGHTDRTLNNQKVTLKNCNASLGPPQVADFDGDGIPDIIVAEDSDCKGDGPYTLDFLKGSGNGTFQPEQVVYTTSDEIDEYFVMKPSSSGKSGVGVYQFQNVNKTVTNEQEVIMVNTTP